MRSTTIIVIPSHLHTAMIFRNLDKEGGLTFLAWKIFTPEADDWNFFLGMKTMKARSKAGSSSKPSEKRALMKTRTRATVKLVS